MIRGGKGAKTPLYRQISEEIRKDILSGIYEPGEILPSIRDEAKILGVARNTVDAAYQILAEEGYIRSRRGVGYEILDYRQSFNYEIGREDTAPRDSYITAGSRGDGSPGESSIKSSGRQNEMGVSISARDCCFGSEAEIHAAADIKYVCDFRGDMKRPVLFTDKIWSQLAAQMYQKLMDPKPYGESRLRQQIRRYLKKHRGISCHEEQIFLYRNLHQAGQMIRKVQPNTVYTIPHHEGSLGNHISPEEGAVLLRRLRENDIYMIEDDIDSELVYERRPYPTLFGEDSEERVILTGTFERILHLNTQFQYVVFPESMIRQKRGFFANMRNEIYHSQLELLCMEVMMESDKWENFLRKTNHSYAVKRNLLMDQMERYFGKEVTLYRTESGPEIIAAFPFEGDAAAFMAQAQKIGLGVQARLRRNRKAGGTRLYVTLHYAALTEEEIREGISLLTDVLRAFCDDR